MIAIKIVPTFFNLTTYALAAKEPHVDNSRGFSDELAFFFSIIAVGLTTMREAV